MDWNEFMAERSRWIEVALVPGKYENGVDVVIRIDGSYYNQAPERLEAIREYFQEEVDKVIKEQP